MQRTRWIPTISATTALLMLALAVEAGLRQASAAGPRDQGTPTVKPRRSKVPAPPQHQQFQVSLRLLQGDPLGSKEAGTLKVLAEPALVTQDGSPCEFFSGGEVWIRGGPRGRKGVQCIGTGLSTRITPTLGDKKGTVFLDVLLEESTLDEHSPDQTRLHTLASRAVGTFKLGEIIKLKLKGAPGQRQVWAELVVREVQPVR